MFRKVQHIHFVGIGGAGMSGIAEILLNMGFRVSGSDKAESEQTRRLVSMGGTLHLGHDPRHIEGAEVLVYSSAVRSDNVEIVAARQQKIPVIPRAEMLAELMRLRYGIAVAGAHGKTTTTTMVATVLAEGGLDPTAVIGGKVNSFGGHAKKGEGDFLVAEADESDGSFLKLSPTVAVVTTIDREHLDYYRTFEAIQATFLSFINKVPFYGLAVLCGDDRAIAELIPKVEKRYLTYGLEKEAATRSLEEGAATRSLGEGAATRSLGEGAATRGTMTHLDLIAEEMAFQPWKTTFQARFHGESLGRFTLPVPGRHNVLNALAAIAVGLELEIPVESIRKGLEGYRGVERRFQLQGEKNGVWVIDDYGHHPTEIRATLAAAKRGWGCELLVLFQPHRYTRTRDLLDDLAGSFADADHLILTDIYAAGEPPIPGIDGERLYQAVAVNGHPDVTYLPDRAEMRAAIEKKVKPGMMVITLGAGDIWKVGKEFLNNVRREA